MQLVIGIISFIILVYFIIKVGQIASSTSRQEDYLKKILQQLESEKNSNTNI